MKLKEIEIIDTPQDIYDCFNGFILSQDTKVFGKLLARTLLMQQVKDLPGDIVECGVFKGTGMLSFLKLKRYLCPNSGKKVIGFDFFNSQNLIDSLSGQDKEAMSTLFDKREYKHKADQFEKFKNMIAGFGFQEHEFELIQGDIAKTARQYVQSRPGFRISLLYLDLDLDIPTYEALSAMWDRVVRGGIVVFDEYAFHKWSESSGADRFFDDKSIQIRSMNYICPTSYVIKV